VCLLFNDYDIFLIFIFFLDKNTALEVRLEQDRMRVG
jgi:hypothetical protein